MHYGAPEQIDRACSAKHAVGSPMALEWSYLYTCLFGSPLHVILPLQNIVSVDLIITMTTSLATYIELYEVSIHYIYHATTSYRIIKHNREDFISICVAVNSRYL